MWLYESSIKADDNRIFRICILSWIFFETLHKLKYDLPLPDYAICATRAFLLFELLISQLLLWRKNLPTIKLFSCYHFLLLRNEWNNLWRWKLLLKIEECLTITKKLTAGNWTRVLTFAICRTPTRLYLFSRIQSVRCDYRN